MEIGVEGAKYGLTGQMGHATKSGVTLFGGHSGMGMLMAVEISREKKPRHIMTVSKRGRPNAPGPARAFVEAMSTETPHYMAACDENDAKAVECLMDWAPPDLDPEPLMPDNVASGIDQLIEQAKSGMDGESPARMQFVLNQLREAQIAIKSMKRDTKVQLQQKECKNKDDLQSFELELQEKETVVMELQAELQKQMNSIVVARTGDE